MDEARKLQIGIVILAAGASVRLGKPKQLLKFQDKSLIRRAAETAIAAESEKVVVVLGANYAEIKKEIEDLPLEIVINENWENGMSSSVKSGLEKLLEIEPNLSAVVILLSDQPLVNSSVLNKLIETYKKTKAKIVASEYAGTAGVPALFAGALFAELLDLSSAGGAKKLIKKHSSSAAKVPVPEAEIDIDTASDYEKLLDNYK